MPLSPEVIAWKRQQERRRYEERPSLQLPMPPPDWEPPKVKQEPSPGSTVIVIEY